MGRCRTNRLSTAARHWNNRFPDPGLIDLEAREGQNTYSGTSRNPTADENQPINLPRLGSIRGAIDDSGLIFEPANWLSLSRVGTGGRSVLGPASSAHSRVSDRPGGTSNFEDAAADNAPPRETNGKLVDDWKDMHDSIPEPGASVPSATDFDRPPGL